MLLATSALDPALILLAAREARRAYEDLISSDGATSTSWHRVHSDISVAVHNLVTLYYSNDCPPLLTESVIQELADRGADALDRAQYAARMVEAARNGRVIDMATIGGAS